MKKFTIQVTNNETGETRKTEGEAYMLLAIKRREEEGFMAYTALDEIDSYEIAQMFTDFENDHPEVMMARVNLIQQIRAASMGPTPGCDCEVCAEKRAAAEVKK